VNGTMSEERRFRLVAAAILVIAAAVRLFRLDHFSYWLDEILQAFWTHGSWPFFWKSLRFDAVHPPLDYLIGKLVEESDPPDWGRKLPSVLWGVGTVASLGWLVARRAGRAAGLLTMALLALAPFHVRYSQELRPYSLGVFLLCLTLCAVEAYLREPGPARLLLLFLSALATAYTLYVAAVVLAVAMVALVAGDALGPDPQRRHAARKLLRWSPALIAALWVSYLPWWPVVLEAASRPSPVSAQPLTLGRVGRTVAFFAFGAHDGGSPTWLDLVYFAVIVWGFALALVRPGTRFLAVWAAGGFAVIELISFLHPHLYVTRRFLPPGIALAGLGGVALAELLTKRKRLVGATLLALVVFGNLRGLTVYFREGRPDWRPLAEYLRREAATDERVFGDDQWSQLCVGFYLVGPDWMSDDPGSRRPSWEVHTLQGEIAPLTWAWKPGKQAWLVVGPGESSALREWSRMFPATRFPRADGREVRLLDPALRDVAFASRELR
jgi:4-amino-4-deoxy-L-arabinose transferase-like glycosyltransferase